jgi:hypothetical protein
MPREAIEQSHLDEWKKQFGGADDEQEKETPAPEEEPEEEPVEEQEESAEEEEGSQEEESEEQEEEKPKRTRTQDDEYRAFIESQPNDELKEQARKLVQGLKSSDGRLSAVQRRLNAREQLINQLYQQSPQSQPAEPPKASTSRSQDQKTEDPQPADELPKKFKALKEKNPEAAEIIDEIAKFRSELTAKQIQEIIDSRLGKIEQKEQQNTLQQERQRLHDLTEDLFRPYNMTAFDIMQSDDFRNWVALQQRENPAMYKLYQEANDANSAAFILRQYEHDYQEAARNAGLLDDEEQESVDRNKGDQIRQKREKSKSSGKAPKSARAGSPSKSREGLSYDEEWKLMWGNK